MNFWFYSLVGIGLIGLGINIGKHGEPRTPFNGWTTLFALIVEVFLIIMAIRHGGF